MAILDLTGVSGGHKNLSVTVFWDVTPSGLLEIHYTLSHPTKPNNLSSRHFEGLDGK
jgi:hypothetical protein